MGQKRQRTEAVLEVGSEAAHLDAGREFKTKPGESFKSRFIDHIRKTGTPVGFPGLCWTTPDFDDAPELIVKFGTPEALRKTVAMTPCPVCSPRSPKYFDGLLGWSPKDKRVRAIGNECGHGHFTDGTFRQSLDAFDAAEALKTAREYLKAVLPDLPRRLFEARLLVKDADLLMRMRDERTHPPSTADSRGHAACST